MGKWKNGKMEKKERVNEMRKGVFGIGLLTITALVE